MATEQEESKSFGNFTIETDNGIGNMQLANELLSPETVTTSTDDIEDINEEQDKKDAEAKKKKKEEDEKKLKESSEKQKDKKTNPIENLLGKEEDQEEETKPNDEEENTTEDSNRFSDLAKDLFDLNVFTKDEDEGDVEISTPQDLLERFQYEGKKRANEELQNFLGRFGEPYQDAFQAIYVKGVNPRDYFQTYDNIEKYSDMDMSVEANQIAVVRRSLTDQGVEPSDVEAKIEKIKSYGDLQEESERFHKVLVKKEVAKLAQLEQESEQKLQLQAKTKQQYAQNVNNILTEKLKTKEFDGIPINNKLATELQDFLVTERWKTPSGETLTEFDKTILELKKPENHAQKVKVALLLKMLQTDPKLSTLIKTSVTKESNKIFESVVKSKSTKETNKQDKPTRWFV